VLEALLAYADAIGAPVRLDGSFGAGLWQYLSDTEAGQARLWGIAFAALVTIVVAFASGPWLLATAVLLGAASLVAVAQLGHQGGTADHNVAWPALFLHMAFAAVWLGGLGGLLLARSREVVARFSSIALLCFVVVGGSGLISGWIRIGSLAGLATPYGALLVVKSVALIGLGVIGVVHRSWAIKRLPGPTPETGVGAPAAQAGTGLRHRGGRAFWGLVVAELALMGLAFGMGAALSVSPTPQSDVPVDTSPAALLTGAPLPAPPSALNYLFGFSFDPIWFSIVVAGAFFYLAGVVRLARRGDRWPVLRTVSWLLGLVALLWATNGGVAGYVDYLFSAHMLAHMSLGMLVPVLLVPGAPITLALRAIRPRKDGSRGGREWILAVVHSPWMRIVGNPYVAAAIFVGSLWVFYYTPLFRWAVSNHLGHEWMILHFLIAGYLFVQALIGIDPAPSRPPYPVRLLLLLATMAFHAFFGLGIMSSTGLLVADWFGAMGWDAWFTALQDQQSAGGIAWSVGELPTLALAITVAVQWARSDDRLQKRLDRKADRDGDAELEAYNAMLARQAQRDGRP